jgi:hypothetical protein
MSWECSVAIQRSSVWGLKWTPSAGARRSVFLIGTPAAPTSCYNASMRAVLRQFVEAKSLWATLLRCPSEASCPQPRREGADRAVAPDHNWHTPSCGQKHVNDIGTDWASRSTRHSATEISYESREPPITVPTGRRVARRSTKRLRHMEQEDGARVSTAYLRFAEDEVRDKSPLYYELLRGAASDPELIGFLLALPPEKRQPNLFLAAARHLFGTPADWAQLRRRVLQAKDALRAVMLARSTQTNEPGRCAALLPVLTGLPEPLALLEVGASAGLCLLPDFYAYDYGGAILASEAQRLTPPVFTCAINAATPVPTRPPRIVWRVGLDLNPVDLADPQRWPGWKHSCGRSRRIGLRGCAGR